MIEEPQNARSQRTREAILEATFALLQKEGAAAVTMAAVAERAGCSRRALYLHFASRAELLVAMIHFADERFGHAAQLAPVREAKGPVERLRAFGGFLGRYHTKIAPAVRAIAAVRDTDDAARSAWEAAMAGWRRGAMDLARELEAEGLLNPRFAGAAEAADLLYALMSIDVLRVLVDERGWSAERYGATMGESFVALLVGNGAKKRSPLATGHSKPSRRTR